MPAEIPPLSPSIAPPPTRVFPIRLVLGILVVLTGLISGYFLSRSSSPGTKTTASVVTTETKNAKIVGSSDTKTFSDVASGRLEAGGIKGEGTHHLIRPGGDSQTVYLVSSLVDLNQFVGQQVELNGQTLKGRYAGWLMDVGRVKILE